MLLKLHLLLLVLVVSLPIYAVLENENDSNQLESISTSAVTPNKGVVNNVVISIRFADQDKTDLTLADYDSIFNNMNTLSFKKYFSETSGEQLTIDSYFFPKTTTNEIIEYQDDKPRNYYCIFRESSNPDGYQTNERQTREYELFQKALSFVEQELINSGLNFDKNDDGTIDNVNFFIQGNDVNSHIIYPHANRNSECKVLGKNVIYTVSNTGFMINNIGTICHEFYHSLGAPDLYQYNSYFLMPIGYFDIMANGGGTFLAYMKWKYGKWFDEIPEITTAGTYSLESLSTNPFACYKIKSPNSEKEYFMLEYRKHDGLIDSLRFPKGYDDGLIIYRINSAFEGNFAGPKDEVYIYRPYGMPQENGKIHNAAFSSDSGRTTFSDTSNPSCFLSDGNLGGIKITDIGAAGETISFKVEELSNLPAPKNLVLTPKRDVIALSWDAPSSSGANGYNIYKVGSPAKLNSQLITTTSFNDTHKFSGDLFYRVTAVYDTGESEPVSAAINTNFSPYILPSDSLVLVKLYNDCNGVNWTNNTNWLQSPVKDWYGISLVNDRVQRIELYNNNLEGELPASITQLSKLETLRLSNNKLSGKIPSDISSLFGLYNLYLSDNQLSGEIPEELYDIQNINQIFLSSNKLEGVISENIGKLDHLAYISLEDNQLTGTIPDSFFDIKRIARIRLANNNFTGSIPDKIAALELLDEFVINNNAFTNLPDMTSLTNLYMFKVSDNNFTFEDLEANVNINMSSSDGYTVFSYAPQNEAGEEQTKSIPEGSDYDLEIEIGGSQNEYEWFKDGISLGYKQTNPKFKLTNVTDSDKGVYLCKVTNSLVPDLTIVSKPINVVISVPNSVEALEQYGVKIFPNPSNGIFVIQHQHNIKELDIFTVNGKKVFSNNKLNNSVNLPILLDGKGGFIIQLKMNTGIVLHQKIVVSF